MKLKFKLSLVICSILLVSCKQGSNDFIEYYTVIFQNDNGDILEIDRNVKEGTMPSYDGETPRKGQDDEYIFIGWDKEFTPVYENCAYTAIYEKTNNPSIDPSLLPDGSPKIINDTIEFGFYPQSYVSDQNLINELEKVQLVNENNWYVYEKNYYVKIKANVYNFESYTFNDNTPIVNDQYYWFKCDKINWTIINNKDNEYHLLSSLLLDSSYYYPTYDLRDDGLTIYPNDYYHSYIRNWLNNVFFQKAFINCNSYLIGKENSSNTYDYVHLLSYDDYLNSDYGFSNNPDVSSTREAKVSEFARANGAWYNKDQTLLYNGSYWTCTPSSTYNYASYNVNSAGKLSQYAVDGKSHCVRPSITISF